MLFRNRALAALLFVVALASPVLAHDTTNLRVESNKASASSALDALSATMPNPVNTWKDEKTGTFYAQNQVFLTNKDPTRAVCDVKFSVPVDQAAQTKVESSYVSEVKTGKSGLDGGLPEYAEKIMPNQSVTLGYLISGPVANAVKMGDFKVTSAKWCEEAK